MFASGLSNRSHGETSNSVTPPSGFAARTQSRIDDSPGRPHDGRPRDRDQFSGLFQDCRL